jgi:DNA polymerase-3 subunit beta
MATDINEIVHYAQDNSVSMTQEQESFVLSSKTSGILNAIMSDGSVEIRISGTQVVFRGQNYKLTAVLVEGHYPNTDKVLSQEGSIKGKVNKVELIQALIRATAMGEKTNSLVTFDLIGDELTLSSEDVGYNKSSFETISIQTNEHEDLHVGFNGSVLAELLKNHDEDDIPIELSSPKQPIIIRANDSANGSSLVSMLMPLVTRQQMQ